MSTKMWEITVEHARTCVLDKKSYFYGSYPTQGVVFNVVGQLLGVFSNGQYVDADKLSEVEKAGSASITYLYSLVYWKNTYYYILSFFSGRRL